MNENKRKGFMLTTIIGAIILMIAVIIHCIGVEKLPFYVIRPDLFTFGIGFAGFLLLLMGIMEMISIKYKTSQQIIEESDERNIQINNQAATFAFNITTYLIGIGLITLALLGYMNKVSFFTLVLLFLVGQVIYFIKIVSLNRRM